MKPLSPTEIAVAETYCKGYIDKEVADELNKPVWTIKTHKKHIFQKLGINTTHEMVLYVICLRIGRTFDRKALRREGIRFIVLASGYQQGFKPDAYAGNGRVG